MLALPSVVVIEVHIPHPPVDLLVTERSPGLGIMQAAVDDVNHAKGKVAIDGAHPRRPYMIGVHPAIPRNHVTRKIKIHLTPHREPSCISP
jgi:hypothetical protein